MATEDKSFMRRITKTWDLRFNNQSAVPNLATLSPWNITNILRFAHLTAWNFSIKDYLRQKFTKDYFWAQELPSSINFMCGGAAGAIALILTNPFDQMRM